MFSVSLGAILIPKRNSRQRLCKILGDKQRALWYVMVFSGVVNSRQMLLQFTTGITIHDRTCLAVFWNSPPNPFTPTGSCFILLLDCRSQYSFFCTCENNILTLEGCFLWHIRQLGFSIFPGEKRWQSLYNQWLWHLVWVWVWNNPPFFQRISTYWDFSHRLEFAIVT